LKTVRRPQREDQSNSHADTDEINQPLNHEGFDSTLRARETRGQLAKSQAIKEQIELSAWSPTAEDSETEPTKEAFDIFKTDLLQPTKLVSKGCAAVVIHPPDCVLNFSLGTPERAGALKVSHLENLLQPRAAT
jgi:hypothetical protein